MNECDVCGVSELEENEWLKLVGEIYLCSVHICEVCGEVGYSRPIKGRIYCDSCFIAEGDGFPCDSCGSIEHIDQMSGAVCQSCDDRSIFGGSR